MHLRDDFLFFRLRRSESFDLDISGEDSLDLVCYKNEINFITYTF